MVVILIARVRSKDRGFLGCKRGIVYASTPEVEALYLPSMWVFRINPKILLPGFRKDFQMSFQVNGVRWGKGEMRYGGIPLPPYHNDSGTISAVISNFIHERLGLFCAKGARGYYSVKVGRRKFIVIKRETDSGVIICRVYNKFKEEVGQFAFDPSLKNVHPYPLVNNIYQTMIVIMGYMFYIILYERVSGDLNAKSTINYG